MTEARALMKIASSLSPKDEAEMETSLKVVTSLTVAT